MGAVALLYVAAAAEALELIHQVGGDVEFVDVELVQIIEVVENVRRRCQLEIKRMLLYAPMACRITR